MQPNDEYRDWRMFCIYIYQNDSARLCKDDASQRRIRQRIKHKICKKRVFWKNAQKSSPRSAGRAKSVKKPESPIFLSPYFRITCIIRNFILQKQKPPFSCPALIQTARHTSGGFVHPFFFRCKSATASSPLRMRCVC